MTSESEDIVITIIIDDRVDFAVFTRSQALLRDILTENNVCASYFKKSFILQKLKRELKFLKHSLFTTVLYNL